MLCMIHTVHEGTIAQVRLERPSSYRKKCTASASRPRGCWSKARSSRQHWIRLEDNRRESKTWNMSEQEKQLIKKRQNSYIFSYLFLFTMKMRYDTEQQV
ncbi:Hypothetical_protein [Hexamita inflata]|uniref:Hypothetical_protein n=1 Tax=Hexamita inflata TaxID=28002 RepID=A0ABP1HW96_9EUKA